MKKLLVTGGAGFIGSNFVRYMFECHPQYHIVVLDALTYAGRRENLADLEDNPNFRFVHGSIDDAPLVNDLIANVDAVLNFAAETHVDRSILEAGAFIRTDVVGTFTLLEAVRKHKISRYLQISTDEVYGSVEEGSFREDSPLQPNSPYSASKAGGDLLVRSYFKTYGVPAIITRSSNNYGPYQYPEKLIPLFITNALDDLPLPLYGDGKNVRDWLFVRDNCAAIDLVLHEGQPGEIYNIGAGNEMQNIQITELILKELNKPKSLITPVKDRPAHDRRYSVDCSRIEALGWKPQTDFAEAIRDTIRWYQENENWWRPIKEQQEEFGKYYRQQYTSIASKE